MKGVLLAGGHGTRLRPLTSYINKHMLPVGKYPMIYYAVDKLKSAGITDILLITGKFSAGLYIDFFGSGKSWGVEMTYRIQEEAGGIAQALALAEGFVQPGETFVALLGDNLFEASLEPYVKQFAAQGGGARVLLKQVEDPSRYGVPVFHPDSSIRHIEEKPLDPQSDYCVTGIYMYDYGVFDVIRRITPSARGELEITDVNNVYAQEGRLHHSMLSGWWTDAGTFRTLREAGRMLQEDEQ